MSLSLAIFLEIFLPATVFIMHMCTAAWLTIFCKISFAYCMYCMTWMYVSSGFWKVPILKCMWYIKFRCHFSWSTAFSRMIFLWKDDFGRKIQISSDSIDPLRLYNTKKARGDNSWKLVLILWSKLTCMFTFWTFNFFRVKSFCHENWKTCER